ncbi:protein stum isoform X2 [Eupeodes corollae]|uniref:protein stum isoform X2 n=1 Tax=Eupeodes corollae TaxID=290404 RepID=UPI002493143D|nr:protein stum isoform X2 [Eupeodes corollae]
MKKSPPSIIPLNYDYQKMSPSSTSNAMPSEHQQSDANTSFYDNQYQSLFGDPVPPTPSEDYFGHLDGSLYGSFRRDSYASAIADDFNRTITLATDGGRRLSRLFSQIPVTSTNVALSSPRLAPDIQILPDSGSGHSSSDPQASPNYGLLRPDDATRPALDETYVQSTQDIESNGGGGIQDYMEHGPTAQDVIRRISDFSEDFKSNVGSLRESPPEVPEPPSRYNRQISNESYSSTEWFKPINSYPEFTKMPKMRPSSKNVLSIKHHEMPSQVSPVAAMIHDSNGSSSSEDQRKIDAIPARPPDPQPSRLRSLHRQSSSTDSILPSNLPPIPPPPLPPAPAPETCSQLPPDPSTSSVLAQPVSRSKSPIIVTESITTGADYRVTAPRTHKKPSFTIIASLPQPSLDQSLQKPPSSGLSPFRGHGFKEPSENLPQVMSSEGSQKPVAMPRMLHRKSLSSTHLKLPSITGPSGKLPGSDDSPRPSVQFNMSGRRASMQLTNHKGILQKGKEHSSSSQDTPLSAKLDPFAREKNVRSCEALPLITDPFRTSIPRLSAPPSAPTKPIIPNLNPTRKQRGLLRVINSADSNSRIPVRSNWASMDDLSTQKKPILSPIRVQVRRRSSSTSPERRSSTQTEPRSSIASDRRSSNLSTVRTSDFSFRRNSLSPIKTPLTGRRKSIFQSGVTSKSTPASPSKAKRSSRTPRKIAKPSTLSPIIGTPNKDLPPTSPAKGNQALSMSLSRRESLSKIPVLNSPNGAPASRSNSRLSSQGNSRLSSRSSSPYKDYGPSTRVPSSRSPSLQSLRPESRLTSRGGSRPVSRAASSKAPSRSTSRASTREISRTASRANSRASSRPNSRMDQAKAIANSRSNSRLSIRSESPIKSRTTSPTKPNQRSKSSSRSPPPRKTRRKSISPGKTRTPVGQRRNSNSRIPARIPTSKSPPGIKPKAATRTSEPKRASPNRTSVRKSPISAKKPVSSGFPRGSTKSSTKKSTKTSTVSQTKKTATDGTNVRRTPSSVKKSTVKASTPKPASSPTGLKSRQPSNLQSSNLSKTDHKRESSTVRQAIIAAAALKREASSMSMKKGEIKVDQSSTNQAESQAFETAQPKDEGSKGPPKTLKRQPSTMALLTIGSKLSLLRKRSDSNLSKKLDDAKKTAASGDGSAANGSDAGADGSTNGKLVALTKPNVISMTTAAITAHPVEISTVLANQLPKTSSSGQLLAGQEDMALPAAILEKSQKTLENIQKTVTEATDEIHKTINENLTDLKTLESDMGKISEELTGSPLSLEKSDSLKTVIEKRSPKNADGKTKASDKSGGSNVDDAFGEAVQKSPIPATHPFDATVTVINPSKGNNSKGASGATTSASGGLAVDEDLAERNNDAGLIEDVDVISGHSGAGKDSKNTSAPQNSSGAKNDQRGGLSGEEDIQKEAGSQDPLDEENEKSKGCCKCGKCNCSPCFCIPCRRSRCCKCFSKKDKDPETAALASSVEMVDEKVSCWKKMKCCKRKPKTTDTTEEPMRQRTMETISEEPSERQSSHVSETPKQGKCGLCMRRIFCCRSVNKVEAAKDDVEEVKKCCFCIPCRKKRPPQAATQPAWEDPERPIQQATEGAAPTPAVAVPEAPQGGCCSRFFQKLNCCKKKQTASESRRPSMKQGPPEETRRKLHVDLVEFNSKMKGAIPVMPLYLAWFCAICNTLFPGLGTLLSGFFCICVGIPRFSMYDSAKARFGSLIINCIVAVAQLFCVLFCFVGWGWSIWWGTIMLKTARKLNKIRKVEKLEEEEEKRQAEMAAAAAITAAANATATDVEAAKA